MTAIFTTSDNNTTTILHIKLECDTSNGTPPVFIESNVLLDSFHKNTQLPNFDIKCKIEVAYSNNHNGVIDLSHVGSRANAFGIARKTFGASGEFYYDGKLYNTLFKEELPNNNLSENILYSSLTVPNGLEFQKLSNYNQILLGFNNGQNNLDQYEQLNEYFYKKNSINTCIGNDVIDYINFQLAEWQNSHYLNNENT